MPYGNFILRPTGVTEFYQVSLKKAEGGAQLGKITTDFVNKFGLISNEDILSMVIHENIPQVIGFIVIFHVFLLIT